MSKEDHLETRELLGAVHESLLKANLNSCQKYLEVISALTAAVDRFDKKYEKRLDDLEDNMKRYVRNWS